jgi:streptogramin lyase
VDNKGHKVWVSDFAGDFIYVFDMRTEQFTQYLLPGHDIRIRDLMVDETTNPPSVWAPDFTPPGKVVKIQAW